MLGGVQAGFDRLAVLGGAAFAGERGLRFGDQNGDGGAKFVGGVNRELFLLREGGLKAGKGGVQHAGQVAQFVVGVGHADAFGEVSRGDTPGGAADFLHRTKGAAGQPPSAPETQREHGAPRGGKPPGGTAQGHQVGSDGTAGQDAFAHFGKVKSLAAGLAHPCVCRRVRARALGPGQLGGGVGGTFEHVATPGPDGEIKGIGPGVVEQTHRLGRKPDFARLEGTFGPPAMHDGIRGRASRRRMAVLSGGGTRLARGRRAAHFPAENGDPPLQFLVDLIEQVHALQLVSRHAEAAQDANQQKRQPPLQTPTDGPGEHGVNRKVRISFDAIALPATCRDEVVSQFFSDAEHMHVHEVGQGVIAFVEEMLVECRARDHCTAVKREVLEDRILARGEGDRLPGAGDGSSARVDDHVAQFESGVRLTRRAADERAQPGEKFGQVKWFDQVIVRAAIEPANTVRGGVAGGEHEHRGPLLPAHPRQHFPTIESRQHDVEHDGVVVVALGLVKTVVPGLSSIDRVALLAQGLGKVAEQTRLIFDDQDSHRGVVFTLVSWLTPGDTSIEPQRQAGRMVCRVPGPVSNAENPTRRDAVPRGELDVGCWMLDVGCWMLDVEC